MFQCKYVGRTVVQGSSGPEVVNGAIKTILKANKSEKKHSTPVNLQVPSLPHPKTLPLGTF